VAAKQLREGRSSFLCYITLSLTRKACSENAMCAATAGRTITGRTAIVIVVVATIAIATAVGPVLHRVLIRILGNIRCNIGNTSCCNTSGRSRQLAKGGDEASLEAGVALVQKGRELRSIQGRAGPLGISNSITSCFWEFNACCVD
jgi:hypothetical protein